jgi:Tyrosine-protein kinase ephrin type A/B receptor-like
MSALPPRLISWQKSMSALALAPLFYWLKCMSPLLPPKHALTLAVLSNSMHCSSPSHPPAPCPCPALNHRTCCTECPPGTFPVGWGCHVCPEGTYKDQAGPAACTRCPLAGMVTMQGVPMYGRVASAHDSVNDCKRGAPTSIAAWSVAYCSTSAPSTPLTIS